MFRPDHLTAEGNEVGLDVTGPGQSAVLLGAGPGAAHQTDDVVTAGGLHTIIEHSGVVGGVGVGHFQRIALVVAVDIVVGGVEFRFCHIQPELGNTLV